MREPYIEGSAPHDNASGESSPPTGAFENVDAGAVHTCGLRADHTVTCWGYNADNQASPPSGAFESVSVGGAHTCGVRADGSVSCWGGSAWSGTTSFAHDAVRRGRQRRGPTRRPAGPLIR